MHKTYRVPEEAFVELDLKVLFQEAGVSSGVPRQFLERHKLKTNSRTLCKRLFESSC